MNLTTKLLTLLIAVSCITFMSCENDDDNNTDDKCVNVTCPPDASCSEGTCVYGSMVVLLDAKRITADETWTNDNIYVLRKKVVVDNGATLTIEPGTIIKGEQGEQTNASALVIARGAKINAVGTKSQPIIFTSVLDNIQKGQLTGTNLDETNRGEWGGLIILGNAPISAKQGDDVAQIEGLPANEEYGKYGGTDKNDNSGKLNYVSIRHGGIAISDGNEINGLTLGGVGSGTTISNVEIVGNSDDGVEFFGGSVNASNLLVLSQGDDGLDIDQNYSGQISNSMVVMGDASDSGFEIDGPENTLKDGLFTIFRTTVVGHGAEDRGMTLKSKAQGEITNCAIISPKTAFRIRESFDTDDNCSDKTDAYDYYVTDGRLKIKNTQFVGSFTPLVYSDSKVKDGIDCTVNVTDVQQTAAKNELEDIDFNNSNVSSATEGADASKFDDWTWSDINGKL